MPYRLAPASFRGQVIAIVALSLAVVALAVVMVRETVQSTQQSLLDEAREQCRAAARELALQLRERQAYAEDPLTHLPLEAQDLSLRGLSSAVLRSYEGISGGYFDSDSGRLLGYSFPTAATGHAPPSASTLRALAAQPDSVSVAGLTVFAAESSEPLSIISWTSKTVVAVNPLGGRLFWSASLALAALLGLVGVVSIWLNLRRGIDDVRDGLQKLETDFSHRLPAAAGEFSEITQAINQMAARRAALDEEYRRQDRLAALGKVVAGVAHEIRNPLNSMRLTLELLARRLDARQVQAAIAEVDRLDAILSRLLAFGRSTPHHPLSQDIAPLLDRAVKMIHEQRRQRDIRLDLQIEPNLKAVVEAAGIEQVLINLLLNATEAAPPGGEVKVSAHRADDAVVIQVADNGSGIPAHARPHMFDAFYTTKPHGTGLGLAVSREILLRQGGNLEFETSDAGTTFSVRLPAEGAPA